MYSHSRQVQQERTWEPQDILFPPPRPLARTDPQALHMLLIEDQISDVFLAEELMAASMPDYQWRIVDRPTMAAAISTIGSHRFDIVLLDLSLDDMEGPETVAALRLVLPSHPILVYSGSSDGDLLRRALSKGAQFCIEKGKTPPRLVRAMIQSALAPEM